MLHGVTAPLELIAILIQWKNRLYNAPVAQLGEPEKEKGPERTFFPASATPGRAWPV